MQGAGRPRTAITNAALKKINDRVEQNPPSAESSDAKDEKIKSKFGISSRHPNRSRKELDPRAQREAEQTKLSTGNTQCRADSAGRMLAARMAAPWTWIATADESLFKHGGDVRNRQNDCAIAHKFTKQKNAPKGTIVHHK